MPKRALVHVRNRQPPDPARRASLLPGADPRRPGRDLRAGQAVADPAHRRQSRWIGWRMNVEPSRRWSPSIRPPATPSPGSGGIRKVGWGRAGSGKSGGLRVTCFSRFAEGEVVPLTLYAKSRTANLGGPERQEIRRALEEQASRPEGARRLRGEARPRGRSVAGRTRNEGRKASRRFVSGHRGPQEDRTLAIAVRGIAGRFGSHASQGWEQGRRQPSGAARTFLAIADRNPKALLEAADR